MNTHSHTPRNEHTLKTHSHTPRNEHTHSQTPRNEHTPKHTLIPPEMNTHTQTHVSAISNPLSIHLLSAPNTVNTDEKQDAQYVQMDLHCHIVQGPFSRVRKCGNHMA